MWVSHSPVPTLFDSECTIEELVPKKNWFGFSPKDSAKIMVICKVCTEKVQTSDGNTMNLCNHLKRQYPKQNGDSLPAK